MLVHISLLALAGFSFAFSETTKRCKLKDNECLLTTANEIMQHNFEGNEKFGFPPIDPLRIDKLDIVQGGNASVQIDLKIRKAQLMGLAKAKVYKISGFENDPEGNVLKMHFKTPLGTLTGPYSINGRMLILPISGKGDMTMNLENLDIQLRFLTKKVLKDGKVHMEIEKKKLSFEVTGANVNFTNLFEGDHALGDNMNLFLNANWQLLLDDLMKPISSSFAQVFKDTLNSVLRKTSYDDLFILE